MKPWQGWGREGVRVGVGEGRERREGVGERELLWHKLSGERFFISGFCSFVGSIQHEGPENVGRNKGQA